QEIVNLIFKVKTQLATRCKLYLPITHALIKPDFQYGAIIKFKSELSMMRGISVGCSNKEFNFNPGLLIQPLLAKMNKCVFFRPVIESSPTRRGILSEQRNNIKFGILQHYFLKRLNNRTQQCYGNGVLDVTITRLKR